MDKPFAAVTVQVRGYKGFVVPRRRKMVMQRRVDIMGTRFDVAAGLVSDADIILPLESIEGLTDNEIRGVIDCLIPTAIDLAISYYYEFLDYYGDDIPDDEIGRASKFFTEYQDRSEKAGAMIAYLRKLKSTKLQKRKPTRKLESFPGVYILKSAHRYKIGMSGDVQKRVKNLKQGLPPDATLIHTVECNDAAVLESNLHQRFEEKRLGRSEWFELDEEDVAWLKAL